MITGTRRVFSDTDTQNVKLIYSYSYLLKLRSRMLKITWRWKKAMLICRISNPKSFTFKTGYEFYCRVWLRTMKTIQAWKLTRQNCRISFFAIVEILRLLLLILINCWWWLQERCCCCKFHARKSRNQCYYIAGFSRRCLLQICVTLEYRNYV